MSKLDQIAGLRHARAARNSSRGSLEGKVPKPRKADGSVGTGVYVARKEQPKPTEVGEAGIKPSPREPKPKAKAAGARPPEAKPKKSQSERASAAAPRNIPKGKGKQGLKPRASRAAAGRTAARASVRKAAPAVSAPIKIGRPTADEVGKTLSDRKPWEAEGLSRASWYRLRRGK